MRSILSRIFSIATITCFAAFTPLTAQEAEQPFEPKQEVLPVKPPAGAVVLFDGTTNKFLAKTGQPCEWKVADEVLVVTQNKNRTNHIVSDRKSVV